MVHCRCEFWSTLPEGVAFRPWVGSRYEEGALGTGMKLLVLGEAHYDDHTASPGEFLSDFTITQVDQSWSLNRDPKGRNFYWRTTELLCCRPKEQWTDANEHERFEAWERVAFANYIQGVVGERADTVPRKEQWESGIAALHLLLETISPDRVLVLGVRNWNNIRIGKAVGCVKPRAPGVAPRKLWSFPYNGAPTTYGALATYVQHPSRFATWPVRSVLRELLEPDPGLDRDHCN